MRNLIIILAVAVFLFTQGFGAFALAAGCCGVKGQCKCISGTCCVDGKCQCTAKVCCAGGQCKCGTKGGCGAGCKCS